MSISATSSRIEGKHADFDCNGDVKYVSTSSYGMSYCTKCGMSSHKYWKHPITGHWMPPKSPTIVGEKTW